MGTDTPLGNMMSKSASVGRLLSAGRGRALVPQLRLGAPGQTCLPVQNDQSLPCNNTKITCHSDASINSQLISPVHVNPLLL